ncbi:MAG TPA: hypothetical protein VKA21_04150 [Candidatus Binatia bacterium]|nr:hypothetical protein [Candidatus Binatia bacterium]
MDTTDFVSLPVGRHDGVSIAVCPMCGRHGRVQRAPGGGRVYDHVGRVLEPAVAGVHVEIIEWCEVGDPAEW